LPFRIGEPARAFVLFGRGGRTELLDIPINATAYCAIIAHRLLESQLLTGGPVGEAVATYTFRLSDGSQHQVPIRERFEIGDLGNWGQLPFLARPDQAHRLFDRWSGAWSLAGGRQTESIQGLPRGYFLWYWKNPAPHVQIESLEIAPRGPRFLVAALTLGLVDEEPFTRDGTVPVRIELVDHQRAESRLHPDGLDLRVTVDRGTSGYAYQLRRESSAAFLTDAFAGWGEAQNPACSPVYSEITARKVRRATLNRCAVDADRGSHAANRRSC
jgi:hypothetical protein